VARNGTLANGFGLAFAVAGLGVVWGCASTEYINEGPGQPTDRAQGEVPAGVIAVCKQPLAKRPPLVNEKLWEDARICTARTPASTIRLGYGKGLSGAATDVEAEQNMQRLLNALREGQTEDVGNNQLALAIRSLRDAGLKDPQLRDRVARETARTSACDYAYLLNAMASARTKLSHGNRCAAEAYDPKLRAETCLFDSSRNDVVWLTSSWSCAIHSGAMGDESSCYRMCGYDDYCAKQVSCAAPDIDLLLCAMGVCLP
jgi:hypothetical protein